MDAVIRFGKVRNISVEARNDSRYIQVVPEGIFLAWRGIGAFSIRDGCEVIVDPNPEVEEHVLRLFILGTVLAMLLHQRGEVAVLHASVVAISGQAVAFVGMKGAGKSTMAAILHARGNDLIADDILAVDIKQSSLLALPGFPHFKLWPDSVTAIGADPETLPKLRPELEKRGHRVDYGFSLTPLPLKRIYVLNQGSQPEIEPLSPQDALTELMPHWYAARFGMDVSRGLGLSNLFLQCTNIANNVPVCRLIRPASLAQLPEVARLVEEHLAVQMYPINN